MKTTITDKNELVIDLGSVKARTKAQAFAVRELIKTGRLIELISYMQSFNSMRKRQYDLPRQRAKASAGVDKLARKPSNSIGLMFEQMLDFNAQHAPRTSHKTYVGVEIECMVPKSSFANLCGTTRAVECHHCDGIGYHVTLEEETDDQGDVTQEEETETCGYCLGEGELVRNRGGSHTDAYHQALGELFKSKRAKWVSVKHDGSIDEEDGYFAVEVTVLTRLDDTKNLKLVCDTLASIGAKVNKSCGMHVHLDARHLTRNQVEAIGENFRKALPVMLAMVPSTRRSNSYCRPCVSSISGDRYSAVNMTAWEKYNTIEVRLHSSTTDFNKIVSWCKFVSAIMQAPVIRGVCNDLMELTEFINLDESLVEYITQRTALFSPDPGACTSSEAQDNDSIGTAV